MTDRTNRNVIVLALCQALMMIGTSTLIAEAALAGHLLATNKALATLPLGLQQLGAMSATFPASFLMKRIGRRGGFTVGTLFGITGTAIATAAVFWGSFELFCVGTALNGVYNGFGLFYRFAAADGAAPNRRAKAISYVLAGGLIAAFVGPETAKLTKDLFAPIEFAGSFAVLIGVAFLALLIVQLIDIPAPTAAERREPGRPLAEIVAQPTFIVAALTSMIGWSSMTFLMTATPLAMVACGHGFDSAAFVIQWHIIAMYAPSFFTGHLINRVGIMNLILLGAALLAGAAFVNLSGLAVAQFWLGLVLLGLGWNFTFVGASTLLTETYHPSERAKAQATNDFLMFGAVTLAALSSGATLHLFGWATVNMGVLPGIALIAVAALWLRRRRLLVAA
jgi:MFS family permease